jgi:ketosteroid isomerase-like protein
MSNRSNIDILKDSYAAFGRGDLAAILRDVDPNVEWGETGPKEIPWAGSFRGHDGVKKFFATIDAEAEIHSFGPETFIADGNHVVVLGSEKISSKRTGRTYECNWAHVFTLAGGKIVKFREYTDTAAVASAFREGSTDTRK